MSVDLLITPKAIDFCGNGLGFKVDGTYYQPSTQENYKIRGDLSLIASNGSVSLINSFEFEVDDLGWAEFKLGRILQSYIQNSLPVLNIGAYFSDEDWFKQELLHYKIELWEEYDVGASHYNTPKVAFEGYAVNGKLDFYEFTQTEFLSIVNQSKSYFNIPYDVEVWPSKHYWLYFYNGHSAVEVAQIQVKIFYTDLTTHDTVVGILNFNPAVKGIYGFPCSMDTWKLNEINPGKEIYKYEIQMLHADNSQLCHKKVFRVIEKPMFVREFCFLNKYGVPEFFHTASKSTLRLVTKKNSSKRELAINYLSTDREYIDSVESAYNEVEITSGNIPKEMTMALQDALISSEFWEVENWRYIPCSIKDGTFEIIPDSEDIVSIKFTYRRAYDIQSL